MTTAHSQLQNILAQLSDSAIILTSADGLAMSGAVLKDTIAKLQNDMKNVPQGVRVATLLPDSPSTAISLLALVHHVKIIPINPALQNVEIAKILSDAHVDVLLTRQDDARGQALAKANLLPLATLDGSLSLEFPKVEAQAIDPGLVLLTSGSTGLPKRVPLTPKQLHLSASRIAKSLQLGPTDRAIHALPMFHIGAIVDLLLAPLIAGGRAHFAGGMGAKELTNATLEHSGTWLQLVPTMLARLQAELSPETAKDMGQKLRFIRSVSSDLAPHTQQMAEAFFANTPIIQMYGMTETAGQITTNPLPPKERKYGSVGQAIDVDLRILDQEVQVKGDCVTKGYEGSDHADSFTDDGWLKTGDLGRIDDAGFLYLTGRIKEMINRGGEKVSPHEVEHAALQYEHVIEAAAFARIHPTLGEEVGLAVTLDKNGTIEALDHHLKSTLAPFKVPRKPFHLSPLPRLGSGKIDRRALGKHSDETVESSSTENRSDTAKLVATAWQRVLTDTDEAALNDTTDFFDAGGDSLSAAQFLFEVERLTLRSLPGNLLYEAPEFGAFVKAVEATPKRELIVDADPKHIFLQDRLANWDAPKVPDMPYMRVLHSDAPLSPLFWCAQEENEYQQLAQASAGKRPIFLMRSLFLMHGKNDSLNYELANDYAKAISTLQPDGPITLGGFCEGAKIMRFVAEHLIQMGRTPKVLISWDQWFDTPLDVPVLHLWSDERYDKYREKHLFPERAIASAHPAGYDVIRVSGSHTDVINNGPMDPYFPTIEQAMVAGINGHPELGEAVFNKDTKGEIQLAGPRFFRKASVVPFKVTLRNQSETPWSAKPSAPLFVAAKIQNLDGYFVNAHAGFAKIETPVMPDQSVELDVTVDLPDRNLPIKISFELVDSASRCAAQAGVKTAHKYLFPNPF